MTSRSGSVLLPREPLVPHHWERTLRRAKLALVLALSATYIVFFTWMFWWRFVTYEDFLLDRANCPFGSHPQLMTEVRSVPQPQTTQQFTLTTTYVECIITPRPPPVVP
jgi:hypothetical protein